MRYTQKEFSEKGVGMNSSEIGKIGEDAACRYLKNKGYSIKGRNIHVSHYEIDILADDNECDVIVEVKTRKNSDHGYPSDFVDKNKIERLKNAALRLSKHDRDIRFDIIEVMYSLEYGNIEITEVNHIENAF